MRSQFFAVVLVIVEVLVVTALSSPIRGATGASELASLTSLLAIPPTKTVQSSTHNRIENIVNDIETDVGELLELRTSGMKSFQAKVNRLADKFLHVFKDDFEMLKGAETPDSTSTPVSSTTSSPLSPFGPIIYPLLSIPMAHTMLSPPSSTPITSPKSISALHDRTRALNTGRPSNPATGSLHGRSSYTRTARSVLDKFFGGLEEGMKKISLGGVLKGIGSIALGDSPILIEGIKLFSKGVENVYEMESTSFDDKLACAGRFSHLFGNESQFDYAVGQDARKNWFLVCWMNNTDLTAWEQRDIDAANCLTNLHYTQNSSCISVEGSMCDNGYVSGGGRLQNIQKNSLTIADMSSDSSISSDESALFQAAWKLLNGTEVRGLDDSGPFVYQVEDKTGTKAIGSGYLRAAFIGEDTC